MMVDEEEKDWTPRSFWLNLGPDEMRMLAAIEPTFQTEFEKIKKKHVSKPELMRRLIAREYGRQQERKEKRKLP